MTIDINSTNRVAHAKVRETTFGVTPTSPAFSALRLTQSTLQSKPTTVVSDEIRSDRQVSDLILVGTQAEGDISTEVSFGSSDAAFEEAFQGTWANNPSIVNVAAGIQISAVSTTTLTVASGGASFLANAIALLTGFPTAANNKAAVVASSTGTTVVFPAATFTAETATIPVGATLRVVGQRGASADIVATVGPNGLTSTALDFTTLGLVVGEWVKIGGAAAGNRFATAANNDWCRISSIAAHIILFDIVPASWGADVGTGKTIMIFFGDYLRNASTMRSSTFERQYLDQSPVNYEYLTGMVLSQLSFDIKAQSVMKTTESYLGKTGTIGSSRAAGATDIAAPTKSVLNASANVGRIGVGGSSLAGPNYVMGMAASINNNLRALQAVGNLGAVGAGDGQFDVTGTFEMYFGDATYYNQLLANTSSSADWRVGRTDGNQEAYLFDMPLIKFASGAPTIPGKNQNVMINLGFQAVLHPTLLYTMHMQRHFYLE